MTSETEVLNMLHLAIIDQTEIQTYTLGAVVALGLLVCWIATWPLRGKL